MGDPGVWQTLAPCKGSNGGWEVGASLGCGWLVWGVPHASEVPPEAWAKPGGVLGGPSLVCLCLGCLHRASGLSRSPRYFLTSFYTKYDQVHFVLNTVSLMSVLIPKLPQLHGVRIFGINKY